MRVYFPSLDCRWTLNPSALVKERGPLNVGDRVCISADRKKVQASQAGHGEWISAMSGVSLISLYWGDSLFKRHCIVLSVEMAIYTLCPAFMIV